MDIFVTGASGFIGSVFVEKLKSRITSKDKVYLLMRKPQSLKDKRFLCVNGSLEEIEKFKQILLKCDYVFHIAANAIFGNKHDYDKTNYLPTVKMINILKKSRKLKDFIFISTIGAVDRHKDDRDMLPLTKQSVPSPKSKYGESKLKSELFLKKSKIPYTIIRPTWVYGRNMRQASHINLFTSMICKKHPVTMFNFPGRVSLIHVDDLATSLVNCIDNQKVLGKTYFAETESLSIGDIFRIIWQKIHKKDSRKVQIPSFKGILSRIHKHLPVPVNNLFIDYLYAIDDDFKKDILHNKRVVRFQQGVDDVLASNIDVSGYWVITGANSGIGLALARILEEQNKNLVLIDRDIGVISKEFSKSAMVIKVDISDIYQIENMTRQLKDLPIYCLVNNAGIGYRKSFEQLSLEEIRKILSVNIEGHITITKLLLEKLKKEGSTIVNVASSIAYNPLPNMLMYSATKAFISNWSESLTYELKNSNNVITFSPSGTDTKFQENSGVKKELGGKGLMKPEYVAIKIVEAVKKKRSVVILGLKTKILLIISSLLPRKANIMMWGKLFEKMR